MNLKLSFNLSVDDWVAFQQYHRGKKAPLYKLAYPLIVSLSIVLLALNIYDMIVHGVSKLTGFSLVVLAALAYILFIRGKAIKQIKKTGLDLQQKHPEAFGPMTMDFTEEGLNIQSNQTSKLVSWEEVEQYDENKNYFFFYTSKGIVYIIPKKNIEDASLFRGLLINYI